MQNYLARPKSCPRSHVVRASLNNEVFAMNNHTTSPMLTLDILSSLLTRLILGNHLTRLAGDGLELGNEAGLWGCAPPARTYSATSSHAHRCSGTSNSSFQGRGSSNVNMCGHNNNINIASVCHTCPVATHPYMASNNVFVIPCRQVYQHPAGASLTASRDLNMLLSGLGLASGADCSGHLPIVGSPADCAASLPLRGFEVPGGPGSRTFNCSQCNFSVFG